ncbi:MAG: FAD-binding oxidoreductase [Saprospiraceae bacterium]|nr:FAD-binding oxidoreductase [Saprospiraceae bacterium]
MENNNYDYILVGQGLAGTLLYWYLRKAGKKVLVVDAGKSSASMAAAGIINPMTGRNYIKTWMADTVMPLPKIATTRWRWHMVKSFIMICPFTEPCTVLKKKTTGWCAWQTPTMENMQGLSRMELP